MAQRLDDMSLECSAGQNLCGLKKPLLKHAQCPEDCCSQNWTYCLSAF